MREAVKRSFYMQMGIMAFFQEEDFYDKRDTIENELKVLDLSGLNLKEIPDLSDFKSLMALILSNNPITDLSVLNDNIKIQGLAIDNTSVHTLPNLPNLLALWADNAPLQSFDTLSSCAPNLTALTLLNTEAIDYSPLKRTTKLELLHIGNIDEPLTQDMLTIISNNPALTTLSLQASEYQDLSFLKDTPALQILALQGQGKALQQEALDTIGALSFLNTLQIVQCGLDNLNFIIDAPYLRTLNVSSNEISDLSAISELHILRELNIAQNQITDLSPISKMTNLSGLELDHNPIDSLAPLSKMKNLENLTLSNGKLSDVAPLAGMKNLKKLVLNDNKIDSVKPLAKVSALQTLDLSGNPVTDPTVLSKLKDLTEFNLYDAPIEDVEKAKAALPGLNTGTREEYELLNTPFVFVNEQFQDAFLAGLRVCGINVVNGQTTYRNVRDCQILDLSNLNLTSLPDMSVFSKLHTLNVCGNPMLDLSPTSNLDLQNLSVDSENKLESVYTQRNLISLNLFCQNRELTDADYAWISNNTHLAHLDIATKGPIKLDCFQRLNSLLSLGITCDGELDLLPLSELKELEQLSISQAALPNLIFLQAFRSVKYLTLTNCQMTGECLYDLIKVKKLNGLKLSNLSLGDYSGLSKLTKLEALSVIQCKDFADLTPIASLKKIKHFEAMECSISNLNPLAKLSKLEGLWLTNNNISDVSPLAKLKKLHVLDLIGNNLPNISSLYKLSNLTALYLKDNPIENKSEILQCFPFADFDTEAVNLTTE